MWLSIMVSICLTTFHSTVMQSVCSAPKYTLNQRHRLQSPTKCIATRQLIKHYDCCVINARKTDPQGSRGLVYRVGTQATSLLPSSTSLLNRCKTFISTPSIHLRNTNLSRHFIVASGCTRYSKPIKIQTGRAGGKKT